MDSSHSSLSMQQKMFNSPKCYHYYYYYSTLHIGNATWVPENPGKPADFQTHKPGFVCGQKPGFYGFKFWVSVLQRTALINRKRVKIRQKNLKQQCVWPHLQLVYSYLQSIPPTSVEVKRAFSTAGILCTKICSCLSDATLDTLCFLRSYYRK